jgi:hypothetical protein
MTSAENAIEKKIKKKKKNNDVAHPVHDSKLFILQCTCIHVIYIYFIESENINRKPAFRTGLLLPIFSVAYIIMCTTLLAVLSQPYVPMAYIPCPKVIRSVFKTIIITTRGSSDPHITPVENTIFTRYFGVHTRPTHRASRIMCTLLTCICRKTLLSVCQEKITVSMLLALTDVSYPPVDQQQMLLPCWRRRMAVIYAAVCSRYPFETSNLRGVLMGFSRSSVRYGQDVLRVQDGF